MAKTTAGKIEVMKAWEEGKKIECKNKFREVIITYEKPHEPDWDWLDYDYIVKEEPKYIPYKDTEEMINDFCERSGAKRSKMGEPFIWFKLGATSVRQMVIGLSSDFIWFENGIKISMLDLYNMFTYMDGSPCGKKEK